jgi:hypothetical protein
VHACAGEEDPDSPRGPEERAGVPENFVGPDKLMKFTDASEEIFRQLFR